MKHGNWIPISKCFISELPKKRPYTKLEAAYSLQIDYDNNNPATINGYSALWQWSRSKVNLFLGQMGIGIEYPENTQKKQNQKGQIKRQIRDRSRTDKEQIRLIESNTLRNKKDRRGTDKGQIRDRSKDTTIEPSTILEPNPNPKTTCSELKNSSKPQATIIIPLVDKTNYKIHQQDIDAWQESYPAVDIFQQLREIREWNLSNPLKLKTRNGIRRHITTWLAKEQNKGRLQNRRGPKTGSWQTDSNIRAGQGFLEREEK